MSGASVAIKPGDTLEGRYKIIKSIGEGGMGTVFLAEHMLIHRKVAIKILRSDLAEDTTVVERFMNEARAAGSIGHPHIVESTDMGFTRNSIPYIVFEYLEGTLLTDEIYRIGGLPVRRALRIASSIASALHAAHNAGIVHRDLKSDNVFLTDKENATDHVKVLDFGISRFLESDNSNQLSANRQTVMGTPQFMAPEQILAPDTVDARADIYALGVVLYEMLTARRPFEFEDREKAENPTFDDTDKLLQKIVGEPPPALGKADLPAGLESLIFEKMLAKGPADRFQSMKDVQGALDAFLTVTPAQSASLPAAKPPSRIGWLLAALVVGGAGAGLFVYGDKLVAKDTPVAVDRDKDIQAVADKLGGILDAQAQSTHDRAEGIAGVPMLRAAIETDAATLQDMVKDRDVLFKARPGEVLEIFQDRDGKTTSMLRMPDNAPAIAPLAADATRIADKHLIVAADVQNQRGAHEGVVALATPLDLTAFAQELKPLTSDAAIVGLDAPIVLTGKGETAKAKRFPIKMSAQTHLPSLVLAATTVAAQAEPTKAAPSSTLAYARIACFALAGLLLLSFIVLRLRR